MKLWPMENPCFVHTLNALYSMELIFIGKVLFSPFWVNWERLLCLCLRSVQSGDLVTQCLWGYLSLRESGKHSGLSTSLWQNVH